MPLRPIIIYSILVAFGISLWIWYPNQVRKNQEPAAEVKTVKLFFYNPEKDTDAAGTLLCSSQGLTPVERTLTDSKDPLEDTIRLLITGSINETEKSQGITTEFPLPGLVFLSASQTQTTITLDFSDPQNKTGGGACRANILRAQIEATARQFSPSSTIIITPAELFQP